MQLVAAPATYGPANAATIASAWWTIRDVARGQVRHPGSPSTARRRLAPTRRRLPGPARQSHARRSSAAPNSLSLTNQRRSRRRSWTAVATPSRRAMDSPLCASTNPTQLLHTSARGKRHRTASTSISEAVSSNSTRSLSKAASSWHGRSRPRTDSRSAPWWFRSTATRSRTSSRSVLNLSCPDSTLNEMQRTCPPRRRPKRRERSSRVATRHAARCRATSVTAIIPADVMISHGCAPRCRDPAPSPRKF